MRHILAAAILLAPMSLTAAAAPSTSANDAPAPTQTRPVSTGVTSPRILYSPGIEIRASELTAGAPTVSQVVLKLTLDDKGKQQDVQVVKSLNPQVDARVVSAVRQFRFTPATLDRQAIPYSLNLVVDIKQ